MPFERGFTRHRLVLGRRGGNREYPRNVGVYLLPAIAYRLHNGLKVVSPSLAVACFLGTGAALLTNRFITFPLYMGEGAASVFADLFWYVVAFNLIKTAAVGLLTLLLYKRLSNFLKKMKI